MAGIVERGRQLTRSRLVLTVSGLTFVVLIALMRTAEILREGTGLKDDKTFENVQTLANTLTNKALPLSLIVAPLVCIGAALAMQFTGSKKGVAAVYCAVGAPALILSTQSLIA